MVRIPLKQYWLDDPPMVMKMLHAIIRGSSPPEDGERGPYEQKSNGHWQLDSSNDWWAWFEGDTLVIQYRYSSDREEALGAWARYFFD